MSVRARLRRWRVPDERHPAAADGERLRPGLIAQPVNTVSSLAYLIAAGRPVRRAGSPGSILHRVAVGLVGVGSVGFHGPGDRVSRAVHDGSLVAVVGLTAASLVAGLRAGNRLPVGDLALLGTGAVVHALTRTGAIGHRPDALVPGHAVWHVISAVALRRLAAPPQGGPGRRRSSFQGRPGPVR